MNTSAALKNLVVSGNEAVKRDENLFANTSENPREAIWGPGRPFLRPLGCSEPK
jgi:hypothetical protein